MVIRTVMIKNSKDPPYSKVRRTQKSFLNYLSFTAFASAFFENRLWRVLCAYYYLLWYRRKSKRWRYPGQGSHNSTRWALTPLLYSFFIVCRAKYKILYEQCARLYHMPTNLRHGNLLTTLIAKYQINAFSLSHSHTRAHTLLRLR